MLSVNQHLTSIIILMLFFSLHQVLATAEEDSNITKATEAILKAVKANGPCNEADFREAIKSCVVIRFQQMADAQNPQTQCIALYNEALCTIDASCQLCDSVTATKTETDIKKVWSDKTGKYKQCAPFYDDFEYAHKQRCFPALSEFQINQGVAIVIEDLQSHGRCEEVAKLKVSIKKCIQEAKQGQAVQVQCETDFNRDLCYIDAACKYCQARTAIDYEASYKNVWADKEGIKKDCAPWYESYEYAHKRRCKPMVWIVLAVFGGVLVLICLCGCVGVGVWCYFGRKEKKEEKILAKKKAGNGGRGGRPLKSKMGATRSAAKSGVKSSVAKSTAVKSAIVKTEIKSSVAKSGLKSSAIKSSMAKSAVKSLVTKSAVKSEIKKSSMVKSSAKSLIVATSAIKSATKSSSAV